MDRLEQGTFKIMANPADFCSVLRIKCLRGSSEHLNNKKHSMVKALYRFHVCYDVRRVLRRLQVPLPHEAGFDAADNTYTNEM